jgi:peroxiredoxin
VSGRARRRTGAALLAAALVGLGALAAHGHDHEWHQLNLDRPPPGLRPPDFALPGVDGQTVRLGALRGRPVLLNFWATWCAPCEMEMPALERLHRRQGPGGVRVVAVNFKEPPARIRDFARQRDLSFPLLLDADGAVFARYRVETLPFTLLLTRDGEIVAAAEGPRDWASPAAVALLARLGRRTPAPASR